MKRIILEISPEHSGMRLDKFLACKIPEYSRTHLKKIIQEEHVCINGSACSLPRFHLPDTGEIAIDIPDDKNFEISGEDIPLNIIYEDKDLIAINKPPGMVVHPAAGNWSGTVVNALMGRDDEFLEKASDDDSTRPGIVHRLDKDTSGCLIIAKNRKAKLVLSELFASRQVRKTYKTIVCGHPQKDTEEIKTLIGRHPVNRKKMSVVEKNGKEAVTIFRVLKRGQIDEEAASLLEVDILTGRTHQIRVHLAHRKLPVIGDSVYGGHQKIEASRQMLHAWKISFSHPLTGKEIRLEAPCPEDFSTLEEKLLP